MRRLTSNRHADTGTGRVLLGDELDRQPMSSSQWGRR